MRVRLGTKQRELLATDVLGLSEADLDSLLRDTLVANYTPGDDTVYINLQGWAELSEYDQSTVKRRLNAWLRSLESRPIGAAQDSPPSSPATPSPVTTPQSPRSPVPEEWREQLSHEELIREEVRAHDHLVAGGGRSWYPLDLLEDVSRNPGEHRDMLRFWCAEGDWAVYTKQWERWQKFRQWQRDNRGMSGVRSSFGGESTELMLGGTGDEDDIIPLPTRGTEEEPGEPPFGNVKDEPAWHDGYAIEVSVAGKKGEDRFRAYALAMEARLRRHGFTGTFELAPDLLNQDKLTTWIEYLNYEYWVCDGFTDEAERQQLHCGILVQHIMDAGLLPPDPAPEAVVALAHSAPAEFEKRAAATAAALAAQTVVSAAQEALDGDDEYLDREEREAELRRAKERLSEALYRVNVAEGRCALTGAFSSVYFRLTQARKKAGDHKILLQWILDQVPLIQKDIAGSQLGISSGQKQGREIGFGKKLEESAKKVAGDAQLEVTREVESEPSATNRKRSLDQGDSEAWNSKRDNLKLTSKRRPRGKTSGTEQAAPQIPLRRSPRIAALRQKLKLASAAVG